MGYLKIPPAPLYKRGAPRETWVKLAPMRLVPKRCREASLISLFSSGIKGILNAAGNARENRCFSCIGIPPTPLQMID